MAGGTWLVQNKVRSGAYINFSQQPAPQIMVGDRGIATIGMELSWGEEGRLIEVYSPEMLDGGSRKKIGYTAFNKEQSKIMRVMLSNCYRCKVFRLNSGGTKATATDTVSKIAVTAKYTGTDGNKIRIQIAESKKVTGRFTITTFWEALEVDRQTVTAIDQIKDNDYVSFDVSTEGTTLNEIAGLPLTGGTNGTYNKTNYEKYFGLLRTAKWQALAIIKDGENVNQLANELVEDLRENEGKKVQVAIHSDSYAWNYEGVIRTEQGLILENDETLSPEEVPALVAALTAGSNLTESVTGKVIVSPTAIEIIGEMTSSEIEENLLLGCFLFSRREDDLIQVEQDRNTYHEYTPTKGYQFGKNKAIRVMDNMATDMQLAWDISYKGKVDNNEVGRQIYKGDIVNYIQTLQSIGAVDTVLIDDTIYDIVKNVTVSRGEKIDAVVGKVDSLPIIDKMEKLYMDIILQAG